MRPAPVDDALSVKLPHEGRHVRRLGAVLWPAFLAAGVLEMGVFALVDPQALHWPGGAPLELSRTAVYSLAFLGFWAVIAAAAAMALWLASGEGEPPSIGEDGSGAAGGNGANGGANGGRGRNLSTRFR